MSDSPCNSPSPFNRFALLGERPASWRRRGLISPAREQHCCLSSILPPLRLARLGAFGGPEQAFPYPFGCRAARAARSGFNRCPAVVIHPKITLWGNACCWPSAPALGMYVLSHAHIIWAPTKLATLYFVGGQIKTDSVECTQQLGVMSPTKNPEAALPGRNGANNSPAAKRQNAASLLHSCTLGRPSQRGFVMANVLKKEKQFQEIRYSK